MPHVGVPAPARKPLKLTRPLSKRERVVNLAQYFDALRAGVPGMRQPPRAIERIHARANALAKLAREDRERRVGAPRSAPAAGAPKSVLPPARRFGPGAIIKYGTMDPPKFTVVDEPDEFLDDEIDGPVSAECRAWWNKASIEERCFYMGRAGSLDPRKAFTVHQADVARWAEETKAAERTHKDVTARAKAAALDAASRIGTNGTGTQH